MPSRKSRIQTIKGTSIEDLLTEIENGGADAVLARTGYSEVEQLAAV